MLNLLFYEADVGAARFDLLNVFLVEHRFSLLCGILFCMCIRS